MTGITIALIATAVVVTAAYLTARWVLRTLPWHYGLPQKPYGVPEDESHKR